MNNATFAFESARVLDGYARLRFLPALFGYYSMLAEPKCTFTPTIF